jgi:hypothetical protein
MDIKKIPEAVAKENKPATLLLNGPDGKPDFASDGTRSTLSIVGVYSDHYQAKAQEFRDAQQEDGAVELIPSERNIVVNGWAITAWHGIESDGVEIPLTDENIKQVLMAAPWIYEKLSVGLNNR